MPTPRERAYAVVDRWSAGVQVSLPTEKLIGLTEMIAAAIDAQVADWMASQPAPNGWHQVAKASHVVEHEPGKVYARETGIDGVTVAEEPFHGPPPSPDDLLCPHQHTRWNEKNTHLECRACGAVLPKGRCIRCGEKATSDESFSCGRPCRG